MSDRYDQRIHIDELGPTNRQACEKAIKEQIQKVVAELAAGGTGEPAVLSRVLKPSWKGNSEPQKYLKSATFKWFPGGATGKVKSKLKHSSTSPGNADVNVREHYFFAIENKLEDDSSNQWDDYGYVTEQNSVILIKGARAKELGLPNTREG